MYTMPQPAPYTPYPNPLLPTQALGSKIVFILCVTIFIQVTKAPDSPPIVDLSIS